MLSENHEAKLSKRKTYRLKVFLFFNLFLIIKSGNEKQNKNWLNQKPPDVEQSHFTFFGKKCQNKNEANHQY